MAAAAEPGDEDLVLLSLSGIRGFYYFFLGGGREGGGVSTHGRSRSKRGTRGGAERRGGEEKRSSWRLKRENKLRSKKAIGLFCQLLPPAQGVSTRAIPLKQAHRAPENEQALLTFSSMKLRQPSLGTNAAIFLPFLISCTRAHLRMAELGCLASMPL